MSDDEIDAYEAAYDRLGGLPRLQSRAVSVRWLSTRTAEVTVLAPGLARNRRARERWVGALRYARRYVALYRGVPRDLLFDIAKAYLGRLNWDEQADITRRLVRLERRAP
jgi:hypothetical protein